MKSRFWVSLGAALSLGACSDSTGEGGGPPPPSLPSDAMCRVMDTLQRQCWSCHGTTLHDAAPNSLVTLEQLKAPSPVDPTHTNAQRAVIRMASPTSPMPPSSEPTFTLEERTLISNWIAAGYPEASCSEAAKDPFAAPVQCTGEQLHPNQQEDERMKPGLSCNACHEQINTEQGGDAPLFALAGTAFPTAHETDDCLTDKAKGAKVEITDARGKKVVLEVNEAGNFFYEESDLVFPYTAKITQNGRERHMMRPQMNGSCNECHTVAGTLEAPGRILLP